jgi:hypothetical protein
MNDINTVSIKIQTGVYAQFRNLNNKVWFALGEYVDNAVQNYENNKRRLIESNNGIYQFEVRITVDWEGNFIKIYDNAAGINSIDFIRAFEPARIPIDNTGLHEFGMGMKTASIWLADRWSVRTAALGEDYERFTEFDLEKVLAENREILKVINRRKLLHEHSTELILYNLSKNAPSAHQMDKIKKHLASIYRKFIRSGDLKLYINDEELFYEDPEILNAPYFLNLNSEPIKWKKEIKLTNGKYSVNGFIGILNTMSTGEVNGLSLFRRGRVIEGSHNEKYRPKVICGQVGSPRYKRIFGELELEGFAVSFDKGSFQEQDDLEALMKEIQIEISTKEFNLYNQAEGFIKPKTQETNKQVAKNIVSTLKKAAKQTDLNDKVDISLKQIEDEVTTNSNQELLKKADIIDSHEDFINFKGDKYKLKVELITEPEITDLYSLQIEDDELFTKTATYKINLAHSFFTRYERLKNEEDYQPIISIIRSLVLAELVAPSQGTKHPGNVRLIFNQFLRNI